MAYLNQDQVLGMLQGDQGGGEQAAPTGQPQGGGSSGGDGGFVSTSSSGAAQQGSGGQGNWTNIQNYLNANKGVDSSGVLKSQFTDKLGGEKSRLENEATTAKDTAAAERAKVVGTDKASQLIQDQNNYKVESTSNYNDSYDTTPYTTGTTTTGTTGLKSSGGLAVGGNTNKEWNVYGKGDNYDSTVGTLRGSLDAKYEGPDSFNFEQDQGLLNRGELLGGGLDEYKKFLGDIYGDAAGRGLTQGQRALQSQLDMSSSNFGANRQNAQNALGDYKSAYDTLVPETQSAIENAMSGFATGQSDLRNYLNSSQTDYMGEIDSAVMNQLVQQKARKDMGVGERGVEQLNYNTDLYGYTPAHHKVNFERKNFFDFTGGDVNAGNAVGVDNQRNYANLIESILGDESQAGSIEQAQNARKLGSYEYSDDVFNQFTKKAAADLAKNNPDKDFFTQAGNNFSRDAYGREINQMGDDVYYSPELRKIVGKHML